MRFFDTNVLYTLFGNTINASSGTPSLAFDEKTRYGWTSDGEDTDGDSVYIENILTQTTPVDRIFIRESNISNMSIEVNLGAGDIPLVYSEIISSADGTSHLYILTTPIVTQKVKITGSNTIVANQEKTIKQIYAFSELGRLENFDNIVPRRERLQKISKLQAGKVDVIDFGRHFSFKLGLKAHYVEDDNDVINMLAQRDNPFFIWINDNTESIMKMYQEPFKFKDLYKVSVQKPDSMRFTKNLYFSGIDDSINMIEVY